MPGLSDILNPVSDVLGVGEGLFQLFSSNSKEKKDAEELARLKQPFYKIQDEFFQNRNIAGNLAEGGLPSSTKNYLTSESEKGLSAGLGALESGGGSPNDISKLFSTYNDSISKNASMDAEAHLKNIDYFMNANKDVAGQKIIKQNLDEFQPYERKLKELTERKAADETSAYNGVNEAIGSVSALGTSLQNNDLMKSFKNRTSTADPFDSNSDYQKWAEQLRLDSMPDNGGQPTSGKFAEGNAHSTSFLKNFMEKDPAAFLKLLDPNSPLFNLSNQPQ